MTSVVGIVLKSTTKSLSKLGIYYQRYYLVGTQDLAKGLSEVLPSGVAKGLSGVVPRGVRTLGSR